MDTDTPKTSRQLRQHWANLRCYNGLKAGRCTTRRMLSEGPALGLHAGPNYACTSNRLQNTVQLQRGASVGLARRQGALLIRPYPGQGVKPSCPCSAKYWIHVLPCGSQLQRCPLHECHTNLTAAPNAKVLALSRRNQGTAAKAASRRVGRGAAITSDCVCWTARSGIRKST